MKGDYNATHGQHDRGRVRDDPHMKGDYNGGRLLIAKDEFEMTPI